MIENKTLEIEKKEAQYLNGLIDIEVLDTAIIEKNELENQIEDLKIIKQTMLKNLRALSHIDYATVDVPMLQRITLERISYGKIKP